MKNLTSNQLKDASVSILAFIMLPVVTIEELWTNTVTQTILYVTFALFLLIFVASLVKNWQETRSLKQLYQNNKATIVCIAIYMVVAIIVKAMQLFI